MFNQFVDQDHQQAAPLTRTTQSTNTTLIQFQEKGGTAGKPAPKKETSPPPLSPRVQGDSHLGEMIGDKATINDQNAGTKDVHIIKVQQALEDMGFLAKGYAPGSLDKTTKKALAAFQADPTKGLPQDTLLINAITTEPDTIGPLTLKAIQRRLGNRQDYIQAGLGGATASSKQSSSLTAKEQTAVSDELQGTKTNKTSTFSTFAPSYPSYDKKKKDYQRAIFMTLKKLIEDYHKAAYEPKRVLREDSTKKPEEYLFDTTTIERAANAAKWLVDQVYGGFAKAGNFKMEGKKDDNLVDQWEHQKANNTNPKKLIATAKDLMNNWVSSNKKMDQIHEVLNGSPSGKDEKVLIKAAIQQVLDNKRLTKKLSEVLMAHPGVNTGGTVSMQRFKSTETDPKKAKAENQQTLWRTFSIAMHEYVHSLEHQDHKIWSANRGGEQYHTLSEGMCEFFSRNAHAHLSQLSKKDIQNLTKAVTGTASDSLPKGVLKPRTVYQQAVQQAERAIGIVGIHNAQLAFFKGKIDLMGATATEQKTVVDKRKK